MNTFATLKTYNLETLKPTYSATLQPCNNATLKPTNFVTFQPCKQANRLKDRMNTFAALKSYNLATLKPTDSAQWSKGLTKLFCSFRLKSK